MQTEEKRKSRGWIALLFVALIVAAAAVYYESSTTQKSVASPSRISSLQSQLTNLEEANSALQAQLASISAGIGPNVSDNSPEGLYANASRSVVTIQGDELLTQNTFFGPVTSVETVQGSGFVVDYQNSSYVVTNFHVVNGVTNITVTFSDGNSYVASVKGSDQYSDLAVLTANAPASEYYPLQLLGTLQGASVGETVYAIGSPFGLSGSMTFGIISQVGRTITESTSSQVSIANVIQFSAPINPGNSGGPLLDSSGQVVGITTAGVSNSAGLYFAIPSSTITRELPALVATGKYTLHPNLGLSGADMTYQLAKATGSNLTYGVLVQSVVSGGPADEAGIRGGTSTAVVEGSTYRVGGDVIISVNGVKVIDSDALASYLEVYAEAGETVQLGILRSGSIIMVSVVLGALPSS
ncbi:MAG TPA: trypsin-like peptidase domain-containing protein [Nitrososphaerales archaeon]|nr:trypsin-like peptidase domain-containing protein [Nitrososphaerales archaeon]